MLSTKKKSKIQEKKKENTPRKEVRSQDLVYVLSFKIFIFLL